MMRPRANPTNPRLLLYYFIRDLFYRYYSVVAIISSSGVARRRRKYPHISSYYIAQRRFSLSLLMECFPYIQDGDFSPLPADAEPGLLYLNSAAKTPLPLAVQEAGRQAVTAQVS
jgi:hypothetical protein